MRELSRIEIETISGGLSRATRPIARIDLRRFALRLIEILTGGPIKSPPPRA